MLNIFHTMQGKIDTDIANLQGPWIVMSTVERMHVQDMIIWIGNGRRRLSAQNNSC